VADGAGDAPAKALGGAAVRPTRVVAAAPLELVALFDQAAQVGEEPLDILRAPPPLRGGGGVGQGGEVCHTGSRAPEPERRLRTGEEFAENRQTARTVSTYDAIRELPVEIESYSLEGLDYEISPEFTRRTTLIRLAGGGHEGVGEDVTYDGDDQLGLQREGPTLPIAGSFTIDSFSQLVGGLATFPTGPSRDVYVNYRRWAYESSALDLALRQAGKSLAQAVGREPRPVNFVVSGNLGEPPSLDKVKGILVHHPEIRFKLDARPDWTNETFAELVALGVVDSIDLKGAYEGTPVDNPPNPTLYARVVQEFPDAWIEDPALTPETEPVLEPARDRITWDAIIHSVSDIENLPFAPQTVNVKPSRFGSLEALCAAYDYCEEHGIGAYGGGQFELGPGRGQIQYLASLFHPDGANDVAPAGFNHPRPAPDLPHSPLEAAAEPTGFRWRT